MRPNENSNSPGVGGGSQGDHLTSPPKSDSIGSGVTDEGEIAAVLSRMLDQAGRIDAQAVTQVCTVVVLNLVTVITGLHAGN